MTSEAEIILHELKLELQKAQSPWANRFAAAAYCNCGTRKIDRAADEGKIKRYKESGIPVFKKAELDKWLEEGSI